MIKESQPMLHELKRLTSENNLDARFLLPLFLPAYSEQEKFQKRFLESVARKLGLKPLAPNSLKAKDLYSYLQRAFVTKEAIETRHERKFSEIVRQESKLNYLTSQLIGGFIVDGFFPSLGDRTGNNSYWKSPRAGKWSGLIVEIDGGVHEQRDLKMAKDTFKRSFLFDLGFSIAVFENRDVYNGRAHHFAKALLDVPRLDSRTKNRMLFKLYLATILSAPSNSLLIRRFIDVFGLAPSDLKSIEKEGKRLQRCKSESGWIGVGQ